MNRFHWKAGGARAAILTAAALGALAVTVAQGATRTDLNHDWRFSVDPDQFGESFAWNSEIPADTEVVNVPHT